VIVDEVDVGGVRLEGLKRVADPARYEHRSRRVEFSGEDGAEGGTGAPVGQPSGAELWF